MATQTFTRLTAEQYAAFEADFARKQPIRTHYRLGQAFLNELFPLVKDPQLFYETDPWKARDLICAKYLQTENEGTNDGNESAGA